MPHLLIPERKPRNNRRSGQNPKEAERKPCCWSGLGGALSPVSPPGFVATLTTARRPRRTRRKLDERLPRRLPFRRSSQPGWEPWRFVVRFFLPALQGACRFLPVPLLAVTSLFFSGTSERRLQRHPNVTLSGRKRKGELRRPPGVVVRCAGRQRRRLSRVWHHQAPPGRRDGSAGRGGGPAGSGAELVDDYRGEHLTGEDERHDIRLP